MQVVMSLSQLAQGILLVGLCRFLAGRLLVLFLCIRQILARRPLRGKLASRLVLRPVAIRVRSPCHRGWRKLARVRFQWSRVLVPMQAVVLP
jgi:hypothetical protein